VTDGDTRLGVRADALPLVRAGAVLGAGLGGFFDGIVLHQILQFHHMLSAHPDPSVATDLPLNVTADGLFHAATYLLTVAGIALLWRAWRDPTVPVSERSVLGSTLLGWGLFNVVEGVVNHQLLGVHHVWPAGPGPVLLWDAAFLAWGVLFVAGGYLLVRGDATRTTTPGTDRARTGDDAARSE